MWKRFISNNALGSRLWLQNTPTAPLQRKKNPFNECPGYETKQSNGAVPVMLELWGMRSTPLLSSLPGTLWPGVVAPDKGPLNGLNRTNGILTLNWIVWVNWISWNRNVLTIKPYLYLNCVPLLNWIIWINCFLTLKLYLH